jgi:anti-sigma regulatory factor (Ser/Thr protein kinase)
VKARQPFFARPESAGDARRFVAETLRDWGLPGLVEPATLLVSELVTNALLHARSEIDVTLVVDHDELRVEVHDASRAVPRARRYSPEAATGRGLHMLDCVATDWGVRATASGKAMWFTISTMHPSGLEQEMSFDFDHVEPL